MSVFQPRVMSFRFALKLALLSGFVLASGFIAGSYARTSQVFAQTVDKQISLGTPLTNPQIKFSELKVGTSGRIFGESFRENRGWIAKVAFDAENISEQEIVGIEMRIRFPETKATGNQMNCVFLLGKRPGRPVNPAELPVKPLSIQKGEKIQISLAEQYENMVRFISKRMNIDDVNKIQIEASFIFFADGTGFAIGQFMRRDPVQENRWIPFEPSKKEDKP
ncbi:MAG TPA: hypothetical protein PLP21_13685 [Pyrinomonadaceae bacterium]|nr:hypothetical protein [Acidobacteriota bacterium]HQZ97368.1 hypothetical protein [Pyrinomonadaceae bacterium]